MAPAYAAFTSLMHLIEDLHEHPNPPLELDEEQFDTLSSKISFFQRFLEDHHNTVDHGSEILMADEAYAVEDLIDSHIADRIQDRDHFNRGLQKVIESLDLLQKEVTKMNRTEQSQGSNIEPRQHPIPLASSQSPLSANSWIKKFGVYFKGIRTKITDKLTRKNRMPLASSQSLSATSRENVVVGIDYTTKKIAYKLTSQPKSTRQIISITGMGGIGKTTLARKIYDHPHVQDYFDIFAWVAISKDYNTRESLVQLVDCLNIRKGNESLSGKSDFELGEILHKSLYDRRYLVILDDVWDAEAWKEIKSFFPNSKGSGVVITTREASVASIGTYNFRMDLLDERNSWDLFCDKVFGNRSCCLELEDIGKNIAKKCGGLPLSIVVIGGHLAKSPRTREYWEYIVKNLSSIVNSENDEYCLKILSLSYTHLPVHLKPCFMYMAIFPEDSEIWVSDLIKLWVAEGFLKPINGKSLEEAARDYLNELIGRNLILASESSRRGKLKSCKIHDLLRDLCFKEASKKNFLRNVRKQWPGIMKVSNNERRIVVHESASKVINYFDGTGILQSPTLLRTLIFDGILPSVVYKSLRVLCPVSRWSLQIQQNTWAEALHSLVNLRFLHHCVIGEKSTILKIPPSSVSLWNLQSLAIKRYSYIEIIKAPPEIWKLAQLRHINIPYLSLPDPPIESNDILKKLQSAKMILNFRFIEDWIKRVPDIKILKVTYYQEVEGFNEGPYTLNNIARLKKLESFVCNLSGVGSITRNNMLANLTLPHSLKKLTISDLRLEDVTTKIGSLPLLEVLELWFCLGPELNLVEGQFLSLKCLKLCFCFDLERFTADVSHFPCLENLSLVDMYCLKEISSEVGDIPTLRSIELPGCRGSVVQSANEIAQIQREIGNEELQIEFTYNSRFMFS